DVHVHAENFIRFVDGELAETEAGSTAVQIEILQSVDTVKGRIAIVVRIGIGQPAEYPTAVLGWRRRGCGVSRFGGVCRRRLGGRGRSRLIGGVNRLRRIDVRGPSGHCERKNTKGYSH